MKLSMLLFLVVFLFIYGAMHWYLYGRLQGLIGADSPGTLFMAALFVLLVLSPVLVRVLELQGHERAAIWIAYIGYTWMGFLFITVCLSLAFDLLRAGLSRTELLPGLLTLPQATLCAVLLGLGLSAWGCYEARNVGTTYLTLETAKLPEDINRVRMVQITDVHLGLVLHERRLARILRLVEKADPDVLVSTGDLVDGQMDSLVDSLPLLQAVSPPWGKFAVMGNHEFYAGAELSERFHRMAGFRMLRNEVAFIFGGAIAIGGVDDPAGRRLSPLEATQFFDDGAEEEALFADRDEHTFRVLLKHQPTVSSSEPNPFDLQLSGHTHGGQIAPFNLVTGFFYRYSSGFHELPGGGHLYVSRGAGTWGPAIRLLAPPEVVVIDLVRASP